MSVVLTFDDFHVGKIIELGPYRVTAEEIIEFARQFDPQPFHLDAESEQSKQVGGLIASGWHTSSMFMRMLCDAYLLNSTSQGSNGLDEVRWLLPVRPNDVLSGTAEVIERRISKSNPHLGILKFDYKLTNQNDETVMIVKGVGLMKAPEKASQ